MKNEYYESLKEIIHWSLGSGDLFAKAAEALRGLEAQRAKAEADARDYASTVRRLSQAVLELQEQVSQLENGRLA